MEKGEFSTGKPTRRSSLGRLRHRTEVNIRMDLKELSFSTRNRVDSSQGIEESL